MDDIQTAVESFTNSYVGYAWNAWEGRAYPRVKEYWDWDSLPLSSVWSPIIGATIYYLGVWLLPKLMQNRKPFKLERTLLIHNFFLFAFSLAMTCLFVHTTYQVVGELGWRSVWNYPEWKAPATLIQPLCYIFYVSKYYELVDTLLLILRKKPVRAVQIWHHSSVLFFFWANMQCRMMCHIHLACANTFVHIFVYGYFCASTLRLPTPWKPYVTQLQIAQFMFDIAYAAPYPFYKLDSSTPTSGDWAPWLVGNFIGVTFIILFYRIYLEIKEKERQRKAKHQASAKGQSSSSILNRVQERLVDHIAGTCTPSVRQRKYPRST